MMVTVEKIEVEGERSLVLATDNADGRKVAFHLPKAEGDEMQRALDDGDVVMAELPDPVDLRPLHVASHKIIEERFKEGKES